MIQMLSNEVQATLKESLQETVDSFVQLNCILRNLVQPNYH